MIYKTYTISVSFDNGESSVPFSVVAVSASAAFQDVIEAYGECILISQDMGV